MSCRKQTKGSRRENNGQPQPKQSRFRNDTVFRELLDWFVPQGELFTEDEFYGNVKWAPEQLTAEALIWSWQEAKNVTDAFRETLDSGDPPLRLRLVKVKVGKTKMWMLTSVLDARKLSKKQIVRFYKMRWGIEVEFRGLKQTIDKHTLRCRNSDRLLVELDWSIRAMAVAELIALREQIRADEEDEEDDSGETYDPQDRSLVNTMRALRKCMRQLHKYYTREDGLLHALSQALVQRYHNHTDKRARYHPKNSDKKSYVIQPSEK